ncbi:MAG: N-acetylglucosamine-6-phosphate deacetylase [Acidobacteria bacterium]|nr:N-acetylglucosamine-6-phosphate deacetylase [Acidobacteriota bacterium]
MKIRGKTGAGDNLVDLFISDGRITEIRPADISQTSDIGDQDLRLAPGLIDIQLNGYDGVDFNDTNTSAEQLAEATMRLWRTGVTAFCPTVITESAEHITGCLSNLIRAADEFPEFQRAMLGIHLEGPFISSEDGPRGAHPRAHTRPPDWDQFQRWQETAEGQIRIITLSPEWPESAKFIERATDSRVIVAIGHTAATQMQITDAVRAGARLSTHLGNGSHAKIDRHPNYIWEQLAADELWASFIVDGHHLPSSVVKCFLRCKTTRRSILVTDAIAAAGRPAGQYRLGNIEVEVTPERRVCLPGTPYLAGSVLEMHEAVAKTVLYSDATLDEALEMASRNPAQMLDVDDRFGSLETGMQADLVLFRWNNGAKTLDVGTTMINGKVVFQNLW